MWSREAEIVTNKCLGFGLDEFKPDLTRPLVAGQATLIGDSCGEDRCGRGGGYDRDTPASP